MATECDHFAKSLTPNASLKTILEEVPSNPNGATRCQETITKNLSLPFRLEPKKQQQQQHQQPQHQQVQQQQQQQPQHNIQLRKLQHSISLNGYERKLENGPGASSGNFQMSMNGEEMDLKRLILIQRELADQYRKQMDKLTEQLQSKLRQVTEENRQLRADNQRLAAGREKLLQDLEAKIVEANEAREMEAIYSSRLTKINRKCKKMQHDEGESYLEFIF